jgi:hypothetical protein
MKKEVGKMKKKKYKLQNTNYKQIPNYKLQFTKKEVNFGSVFNARDKFLATKITESFPFTLHQPTLATHLPPFYLSPLPNKQYSPPMYIFNVFVILSLWFVCNLYFVICNFLTPLPSFPPGLRRHH